MPILKQYIFQCTCGHTSCTFMANATTEENARKKVLMNVNTEHLHNFPGTNAVTLPELKSMNSTITYKTHDNTTVDTKSFQEFIMNVKVCETTYEHVIFFSTLDE